jgi:hypothetical protein
VTPESRLPIRAGFCSHYDSKGRVVFDCQYFPYLWNLMEHGDQEARKDFYDTLAIKRAAGITHVVTDAPDGTVYDADWVDSLPNWMAPQEFQSHFIPMVRAIVAEGFVPVQYYFGGGQADAPAIYDGRLRELCVLFKQEFGDISLHVWSWESFGRSRECTARQNWDAWHLMRAVLGSNAYLVGHVDSSDPCRFTWASYLGDGPESGTPQGCTWRDYRDPHRPGIGEYVEHDDPSLAYNVREPDAMLHCPLDILFTQTPLPNGGPNQPDQAAKDRQIEGWDRYAAPGTFIPLLNRNVTGPDWFHVGYRKPVAALDRMIMCLWEPSIPYGFIRFWFGPPHVRDVKAWADSVGLEHQGCLPA